MLLEKLHLAVQDKDMQWALELSDYLISLDLFTNEVKELRTEALIYEGSRSSNPNKRNYFLTSAFELNGITEETSLLDRTSEDLLHQISISTLFDVLSTRYNPEGEFVNNYKVCFSFLSGVTKNITLRNKVAVISNNVEDNCDLRMISEEIEFKKTLTGLSNPVTQIASGDLIIEGGSTEFLNFLTKFR